jgi:hypothetical protein
MKNDKPMVFFVLSHDFSGFIVFKFSHYFLFATNFPNGSIIFHKFFFFYFNPAGFLNSLELGESRYCSCDPCVKFWICFIIMFQNSFAIISLRLPLLVFRQTPPFVRPHWRPCAGRGLEPPPAATRPCVLTTGSLTRPPSSSTSVR